jgi:hypothetical protein
MGFASQSSEFGRFGAAQASSLQWFVKIVEISAYG